MGMKAYITCIGPFSEEVRNCLSYDAEFYKGTKPGVAVITDKLHCNTNDQSRDLAEALGCDAWDFDTHHINPKNINWLSLYAMGDTAEWNDKVDIGRLDILVNAGFMLMFMPNG